MGTDRQTDGRTSENELKMVQEADIGDDLVGKVDPRRIHRIYEDWPRFAEEAWNRGPDVRRRDFQRVVYLAVGGSAAAGDIVSDWLTASDGIELSVFKGVLPRVSLQNALVIACSTSGNSEETLEMAKQASRKGAETVAIASGGKLEAFAESAGLTFVKIPMALSPRFSLPYSLFATLAVLRNASLLRGLKNEIDESIREMKKATAGFSLSTPGPKNPAKKLAQRIMNVTPKIYASQITKGVAKRFKNTLNENAKMHAYSDSAPEMFHNEVESWEVSAGTFLPVFLRHTKEQPEESERIGKFIDALEEMGVDALQLSGRGESAFAQLLTLVYRLDFSAYYAAILRGVDPFPIRIINKLK